MTKWTLYRKCEDIIYKNNKINKGEKMPFLPLDKPETDHKDENKKIAFLFDATGSRRNTWEEAQKWQEEIINEFASAGAEVGIVVHRGGKVKNLGWLTNGHDAKSKMAETTCKGGYTQIAKGLRACAEGPDDKNPKAIIMVGDDYEEEEEHYTKVANELKKKNIPVHAFLEDNKPSGKEVYEKIANITGGVFIKLGPDMPLKDLVRSLFVYSIEGKAKFEIELAEGNAAALVLVKAGLVEKSNTENNSKNTTKITILKRPD